MNIEKYYLYLPLMFLIQKQHNFTVFKVVLILGFINMIQNSPIIQLKVALFTKNFKVRNSTAGQK